MQACVEFIICCNVKIQRNKNFSFPTSMQYFTKMHCLSCSLYLASWSELFSNRIQMEENTIKWGLAQPHKIDCFAVFE